MKWDTRIKDSIAAIQRQYGRFPRSLQAMYSILGLPSVCSYQSFRKLYIGDDYQVSRVAEEVCQHLEVITTRAETALITDSVVKNQLVNALTQKYVWVITAATTEPFEIRLQHKLDLLHSPSRMHVLWVVDDPLAVDIAHVMPYLIRGLFRLRGLRDQDFDAHLIVLLHPGSIACRFQGRVWRPNTAYEHVSVMSLLDFLESLGYQMQEGAIVKKKAELSALA